MPLTNPAPQAPILSPAVRDLIARRPVFDAHADSIGRALDLGHDLGVRGQEGHLDLVRGAEGGLGSWVVVSWVDPELYATGAFARASAMMAAARELELRHPDRLRLVGNLSELHAAHQAKCVAGILGIEGGHAIEEDLGNLHILFEGGLRVMTLVWNNHLSWIRSCQAGADASIPTGLGEFGREVVAEMNYLGILVDVSHASEAAFYDVLTGAAVAPIASHSGCKALHDHQRNLTDDQLRHLAQVGGVVGVVFHPGFLSKEAREEEARVRQLPAYRDLSNADAAQLFLEQQVVMRAQAQPMAARYVVDHICHVVDVAGIDHVGIGSDYDGIERGPEWMEDARGYGVLAQLLVDRGFSIPEVEQILGGNMERVFGAATAKGSIANRSAQESLV
jgi:membrane dipeptidase